MVVGVASTGRAEDVEDKWNIFIGVIGVNRTMTSFVWRLVSIFSIDKSTFGTDPSFACFHKCTKFNHTASMVTVAGIVPEQLGVPTIECHSVVFVQVLGKQSTHGENELESKAA